MQSQLPAAVEDTFALVVHSVMLAIEAAGVLVLVGGALFAVLRFLRKVGDIEGIAPYERFRSDLGRAILLGLELLVAADIIGTVAIEPTLERVAVLGVVVLIRTFLSFSLEVEINGHWPWQGAARDNAREDRRDEL